MPEDFLRGENGDVGTNTLNEEVGLLVNFLKTIRHWCDEKNVDYDESKGARRYANERIANIVKTIKIFIVVTGLRKCSHSECLFFKTENKKLKLDRPKVKLAVNCKISWSFVDSPTVHIKLILVTNVTKYHVLSIDIKHVNSELPFRKATTKEITISQVATQKQIIKVYQTITNYLYLLLDTFERNTCSKKSNTNTYSFA